MIAEYSSAVSASGFVLILLTLIVTAVLVMLVIVSIWLIIALRRLLIEIRDACTATTMEVRGVKIAIERLGQPK